MRRGSRVHRPPSRGGTGAGGRAQADGRWVVDAGALWGELFFLGLRGSRRGLSLGTVPLLRLVGAGGSQGSEHGTASSGGRRPRRGRRLDGERVECSVSST